MSNEEIDRILEIVPEVQSLEAGVKTTIFAKIALYMALLLIPIPIGVYIIVEYLSYRSEFRALNGLLWYCVIAISPLSILLAIIALIRISLSKSMLKGRFPAILGIVVSVGSFLLTFYVLISHIKFG